MVQVYPSIQLSYPPATSAARLLSLNLATVQQHRTSVYQSLDLVNRSTQHTSYRTKSHFLPLPCTGVQIYFVCLWRVHLNAPAASFLGPLIIQANAGEGMTRPNSHANGRGSFLLCSVEISSPASARSLSFFYDGPLEPKSLVLLKPASSETGTSRS